MLKRLRKSIQDVAASPTRGGSADARNESSAAPSGSPSGFICPMCMKGFPTPDDLQSHFDHAHAENGGPEPSSPSKGAETDLAVPEEASNGSGAKQGTHYEQLHAVSSKNPNGAIDVTGGEGASVQKTDGDANSHGDDTSSVRNSIIDLESSLKEEKWYAEELKSELEKAETKLKTQGNELELIQQQMSIAIKTNEDLAREKETIMQKVATQSQECARLQSYCDELKSEKAAQAETNQNQSAELEKAAVWIRDLESQLVQRPGADDVLVLKKELVSVQTLMDQLTLDSEKQKDEATQQCKNLEEELEAAKQQYAALNSQYNTMAEERENKSALADSVQEKLAGAHSLAELQSAQTEKIKEELTGVQADLAKEKTRSKELEVEKSNYQQVAGEKTQEVDELKVKLKTVTQELSNSKMRFTNMESQLEEVDGSKSMLQSRIQGLLSQLETLQKEKDANAMEKDARIDALTNELSDLKADHGVVAKELEAMRTEKKTVEAECEKLNESCKKFEMEKNLTGQNHDTVIEEMKRSLAESGSKVGQLQEHIERLENEAVVFRSDMEDAKQKSHTNLLEAEKEQMQLQINNEKLQGEVRELRRAVEEEKSKAASCEASGLELSDKLKGLEAEKSTLKLKTESLARDIMNMNEKIASTERDRDQVAEEVRRLQQERNTLLEKMEVGEGQAALVGQLRDENDSLRKQLENSSEKYKQHLSQHEAIVKEHENNMMECKNTIKSQTEEVDMLHSNIRDLESSIALLNERDSQTTADLEGRDLRIKEMEQAIESQKSDMNEKVEVLQRSVNEKTRESDKLLASLETLKTSNEAALRSHEESTARLQDRISQLQQDVMLKGMKVDEHEKTIEKRRQEIETLNANAENTKQQRQQEVKTLKSRHAEKVAQLESTLKSAQEQHLATKMDLETMHTNIMDVECKLSDALRKLKLVECEREEATNTITTLNADLDSGKAQLANLQNSFEKSKMAWVEEKNELDATNAKAVATLKTQHASEVKQLSDGLKVAEEENKRQIEQMEADMKNKDGMIESKDAEIARLNKAFADKEVELSGVVARMTAENEGLSKSVSELTSKCVALDSSVVSLDTEREQMQKQIDAKEEHCRDLESARSKLQEDYAQKDAKLCEVSEELTKAQASLVELTEKYESTSQKLTQAETAVDESSQQITKLVNQKSDLEASLEDKSKHGAEVSTELASVRTKLEDAELQLQQNADKLSTLQTTAANNEQEISQLKADLTQAQDAHQKELEGLNSRLEEEVSQRNQEREKLESESRQLESQWKEKEMLWESEKEELVQSRDTLTGAQKILINAKMELQRELDSAQTELKNEIQKLGDIETMYRQQQNAAEAKILEVTQKLNEADRTLAEMRDEKQKIEARLQLEVTTLRENLDSVRAEWQAAMQQVERLRFEADELKGQIVVLQATVQNNADERRTLLERCITAEQVVEQLNANEQQLKRRLDDAQAAMHELGRENQAMQVKHTTVLSRQWADDKEAVECLACQRPFSITLRRHHCRHCGNIFCADCSSRSTMVASSKKPVRVCEKCYDDLLIAQ